MNLPGASGWVAMAQGEGKWLTHNVGGDLDDYVIDMQCKDSTYGINKSYGGDLNDTYRYGAWYDSADSSHIWVKRETGNSKCDEVRIRYDLSWHVLAPGGREGMASGSYAVHGTLGQFAIGPAGRGETAAGSGYWSGLSGAAGGPVSLIYPIYLPLVYKGS